MSQIETQINIDAPAETVWAVLTDFPSYHEWNPFIPSAQGVIAEGERLKVRIVLPGQKGMTFRPRLIRVRQSRELRWLGHLGVRGIFDGEHAFEIRPNGTGCTFIQSEQFTGVLASWLMRSMGDSTRRGFESMNETLKHRCEAMAGDTPPDQPSTSPISML
jgi:hypothetical protein